MRRRRLLTWMAALGGSAAACGCARKGPAPAAKARKADFSSEEYVWLSANAHLPLFVAHDHPALFEIGRELGVKVTIAGPNSVDLPGLVAAIEQTIAGRPTGIMVVGWDPSALVPAIDKAVDSGVPVVCVDADVPASKRIAFIGTDWYNLGVQQGRAMVAELRGRTGKVAMLGLIELHTDQQAFAGFRSVVEKAGLQVMEPQQDKGNQAEAARVAAALLQAIPGLVGIAGFDSESGPGIALAIKESGKVGKLVGTAVDAEEQHLAALKEGALSALVMQKRELFTYYGVKALFDCVHSPLRLTKDDRKAGVSPIPVVFSTGTCTITRENLEVFL
ncbi:MAG: substrate-binding domain-containing protein [Acidobacteriota bacterium]